MKHITFNIDTDIQLTSKDCTQADIASIASYCILALAQDNKVQPDDIVRELLRICKGSLKQESDHKQV